MAIVAQSGDRLDLIALRVYGNIEANTLRTLIWANPTLIVEVEEGTVIETPPVVRVRVGAYRRLVMPDDV